MIISTIILAAGESRRMGQVKQMMPFGESTILEQVIDNLLGSKVNEIIVVLGHKAEEVKKTITAKQVKIVINPDYMDGMSTSIITGLKLVDRYAQAVMIFLGDQPFVDSKTIDELLETFITSDKGIVIPIYQGIRGNPVIFTIGYKNELLKLKGDIGGREIISRNPDDVLEVKVNTDGILADIDTPDNYKHKIDKSM